MATSHIAGAWWRWPLVPLASLSAAFLASGALNVALFLAATFLLDAKPDGWILLYAVPFLSYGTFGHVLSLVSYAVAPHHKLASALTMMAVMLILFSLALVASFFLHGGRPHFLIVGIPAACIFAAVASIQMHKGLLESSPQPAGP